MPNYRRNFVPGGTFFFTVVTFKRRKLFLNEHAREALRLAYKHVQQTHPSQSLALVLLPDHLHCVWELPRGDADFSTRWRLIKREFRSRLTLQISPPHFQRRFWEHTCQDEDDLKHCVDYIHSNPVKHKLAKSAAEWPWSTFRKYVREGEYPIDWSKAPTDFDDRFSKYE